MALVNRGRREEPYRINEDITAHEVRVIGFDDESRNKVYRLDEARALAEQEKKDLVEVAPNAIPPVCRIVEYTKFKYEQKKREKENKTKQHVVVVKEIRFGPNTDEHDFNFKLKHARSFLQEGAKVKVEVFFRGRSIVYKDQGEIILLKFAQELMDFGKVEKLPLLEGKRMIMIIAPKKSSV